MLLINIQNQAIRIEGTYELFSTQLTQVVSV